MLKRLSLKVKLTGIFILIFGGSLVAYSIYIYRTVDTIFQHGFDSQLYEFASDIGDSVNFSLLTGLGVNLKKIRESNKFFPFTSKDSVIQIRALSGQLLATVAALKNQNLPYTPREAQFLVQSESLFQDWQADEPIDGHSQFRVITYLVTGKAPEPLVLQVGVPDELLRRNNRKIAKIFVYSIPFILLLSGFVGYSYAGFSLSPMQRMRRSLDEIKARKLSARVALPESRDEIHDLAITINEMLDRVEGAFNSQDRFVSDASHQLKTPLAILKGELERLAKDCGDSEDLNSKTESLREEVDSLIVLVNNLLLLARVDAGEFSAHFRDVPLDEVVSTACTKLSPFAQAKEINLRLDLQIEVESDHPFLVHGDPELLISLFQSLIENSIKYSPEKTTVDIQVVGASDFVRVDIFDEGPGLGEKAETDLFQRFSRGSKLVSGSGLGLSIAKQISELHLAEISISSRSPVGTKASFRIKKV